MKLRRLAVGMVLLAVAACSKSANNVTSPTPSAAPTTAPQAPATSGPAASASSVPGVPHCSTSDLSGSIAGTSGAAGSTYETLELMNHSSAPCTLSGYPGVSLVDASGNQLGQPATRDTSRAVTVVTLSGHGSAYSVLRFPNPDNFSAGQCSAEATNLRVYPPGQTQSLLVPSKHKACPGFSVNALSSSKT